jgi:hypothetical protein
MMTLAIILGPAGAVLLLVSLVGGGFSFSGWAMPKIGKIARIPCFVIGGVLVLLSISLAVADSSMTPAEGMPSDANMTLPVPMPMPTTDPASTPADSTTQPTVYLGEVFFTVDAYESPDLDAAVTSHLYAGDIVEIYCTVQGEAVTDDTGFISSLWNGTNAGFVPDVAVDTGTDQATMPPC